MNYDLPPFVVARVMQLEAAPSLIQVAICFALGGLLLGFGLTAATTGKMFNLFSGVIVKGERDAAFWFKTLLAVFWGTVILCIGLEIGWKYCFVPADVAGTIPAVQPAVEEHTGLASGLAQFSLCLAFGGLALAIGMTAAITGKLHTVSEIIEKEERGDLFFWASTTSVTTFGMLILGVGLAVLWDQFN